MTSTLAAWAEQNSLTKADLGPIIDAVCRSQAVRAKMMDFTCQVLYLQACTCGDQCRAILQDIVNQRDGIMPAPVVEEHGAPRSPVV